MARPGYHQLNAQIPLPCWAALLKDADAKNRSASEVLATVLCKHYKIDPATLPPRARVGRKPNPLPGSTTL